MREVYHRTEIAHLNRETYSNFLDGGRQILHFVFCISIADTRDEDIREINNGVRNHITARFPVL